MAENTKIEWADHTFNPWVGCTAVSPACDHCYAKTQVERFGGNFNARRRTSESYWQQPLRWDRRAEKAGVRDRVFCASLADVFDNQAPDEWRTDLWRLIEQTPHLDWLLLTKRPQNIMKMMITARRGALGADVDERHVNWPWPNIWLGTTVENQGEANRRIPHLLSVPAKEHFLSCEPLLGPLDLTAIDPLPNHPHDDVLLSLNAFTGIVAGPDDQLERIGWVIAGGESGPGARPMHPDWARSLRDQCAAAGVPFHFKQWGEFAPVGQHVAGGGLLEDRFHGGGPDGERGWHCFEDGSDTLRIGKARAGRLLDGIEHNGVPGGAA